MIMNNIRFLNLTCTSKTTRFGISYLSTIRRENLCGSFYIKISIYTGALSTSVTHAFF